MTLSTSNIIKLLQVKGIGRGKVFRLNELFPFDPKNDSDLADLLIEMLPKIKIQGLNKSDILMAFQKGETLYEASKEKGINTISYGDSNYPELLKSIAAPPIILNVLGNIDCLQDNPGVAVIGTRQPSTYGRQVGERIGYKLGENKINVISGLAIGCDTAGHVGCLKAGGTTIAILAHGLDKVYPKENENLAKEIVDKGGCLLSEYMIKTSALANFFVERDRIQAGLSKATFVIETDIKGGTMHAVNATIENKRLLAAFNHPANKQTDKSRGNQMLIRERKAIGIETKEDIEKFIKEIIPGIMIKGTDNKIQIDTDFVVSQDDSIIIVEAKSVQKKDEHHADSSNDTQADEFVLTPPPPKKSKPRIKKDTTNTEAIKKESNNSQ